MVTTTATTSMMTMPMAPQPPPGACGMGRAGLVSPMTSLAL